MTSYASNHSTGDTQHNVRDAALHGAFLAFSKPPVKPKPPANTYTGGNNGALLAATKVGSPRTGAAGSPASLTKDWTGSRSVSSVSSLQAGSKSNSTHTLNVSEDHADRTSSPSNIAARLAAARYSPLRPVPPAANVPVMSERHANERDVLPPSGSVGNVLARLETTTPRQQPRRTANGLESQPARGATTVPKQQYKPTDFTPVPPTASRGKMFEQSRSTTPPRSAAVPLNTAQHSPPPVRSPKPQRAFKLPPEPTNDTLLARQKTRIPPPIKPKPKHQIELPPAQFTDGATYFHTPQKDPMKSPPIKQKPTQLTPLNTNAAPPPKPPPQRGSREARPMSEEIKLTTPARRRLSTVGSEQDPPSPASFKSAKEVQEEEERLKPSVPPPRRSNTRKPDTASTANRPRSTAPVPITLQQRGQQPNPMRSPTRLSPPHPTSIRGTSPGSVYHNNYQRDSVRQITQHMTGESLSSAIMGAALASSRNVSPAPAQPVPIEPLFPPRRQHHHHSPFRRSPSPPKQSPPKSAGKLRTTMRKEPSSSDDEDQVERYKKKGTRIMGIKGRKHPNKHHEGTRNRWRDQITDRERKRYEGVWAANKGFYLPAVSASPGEEDDPTQNVLNLAVQDIWTRSRLPVDVLEEVWDLVDSRAIGSLKRVEFVVGLWLIDQRLKGRKLPIRVSESVWTSARGVGIKVKVRG